MAALETLPIATMDKLIVASDGSKCSESAVREAIQLAKRYGSKLYAVCTAQVTLGQLEYAADVVSEFDKAARKACESVRSRAEAEGVQQQTVVKKPGEEVGYPASATLCNKCHTKAVVVMDNCATCLSCGYSKCG